MSANEDMVRLMQHMTQILERLGQQSSNSGVGASSGAASTPPFPAFDPTAELWKDYWARFQTFAKANAVPTERLPQVFLTNQTAATYKLLTTLASQQDPPKDINDLTMDDILVFMGNQYDPKRFIVRERFKFWSEMQRKPGETVQELAARIRQDASKCDFPTIKDPQDEAMRTRFICSVGNEAVLKAIFKIPDDQLTFTKAVEVAQENEDAAKVAKETVYGSKKDVVFQVKETKEKPHFKRAQKHSNNGNSGTCMRCGGTNHRSNDCKFKDSECHFCHKKGHLEKVCMQKRKHSKGHVGLITEKPVQKVNTCLLYTSDAADD